MLPLRNSLYIFSDAVKFIELIIYYSDESDPERLNIPDHEFEPFIWVYPSLLFSLLTLSMLRISTIAAIMFHTLSLPQKFLSWGLIRTLWICY